MVLEPRNQLKGGGGAVASPLFSVKYYVEMGFFDVVVSVLHAADWDWHNKKGWSISMFEDMKWEFRKHNLDEESRLAILKKFGLIEWKEEFPLEMVEKLSPVQLMRARRRKEKENKLPRLEAYSDNLHCEKVRGEVQHPAEEYD